MFTVSFHHKASDFYPAGSGRPQEVGEGSGLYHNLNIPLKAGCSDEAFTSLFEEVVASLSAHLSQKNCHSLITLLLEYHIIHLHCYFFSSIF